MSGINKKDSEIKKTIKGVNIGLKFHIEINETISYKAMIFYFLSSASAMLALFYNGEFFKYLIEFFEKIVS